MTQDAATIRTPETLFEVEIDYPPEPTREQLLRAIDDMQADWAQLNELLNATAVYYSWCSDWEERVRRYNERFRLLKLEGRPNMSSQHRQPDTYLLPFLLRTRVNHETVATMVMSSRETVQRNERCPSCGRGPW